MDQRKSNSNWWCSTSHATTFVTQIVQSQSCRNWHGSQIRDKEPIRQLKTQVLLGSCCQGFRTRMISPAVLNSCRIFVEIELPRCRYSPTSDKTNQTESQRKSSPWSRDLFQVSLFSCCCAHFFTYPRIREPRRIPRVELWIWCYGEGASSVGARGRRTSIIS